jgi:hypothetical protein
MAWDDAKRAKAVEKYQAANPTDENTMEIVEAIAEELGETKNGVRMILTKAEVYIKKSETASKTTAAKAPKESTRVSKADSIAALVAVIESTGYTVDNEIVDKLTGKQAVYLALVIKAALATNEE